MQILITPHPFLRHVAKPLSSWDKKTAKQVKEMEVLLRNSTNPKGVGLAATQVGLDKRIFILLTDEKLKVFINPQITQTSQKMLSDVYKKKKDRWLEGCLSIPKIWGFVDRPFSITLRYQVPEYSKIVPTKSWILGKAGKNCKLKIVEEVYEDVDAAYIQHELDHLNGILFTDHILKQGGQVLRETDSGLTPIH